MADPAKPQESSGLVNARAEEIFSAHFQETACRTDRLFAGLLLFEWLGGILMALWVSPKTWAGIMSQTHVHVTAAIFLGGAITLFPAFLGWKRPGQRLTRHVIACGQMLTSALLIHLSGGRIETHFHVFGSLAFLAFYRDWQVILTATVLVVLDHAWRGFYWPQSVYGVSVVQPLRFLEHASWVVFEDVFLIHSIRQGLKEMREIAGRQVEMEKTNETIERKVQERTEELTHAQMKLTQSEKMSAVGQLAAGVAHEINNPLGVILGFSQGVVSRLKPGDALETPLKSIEREAMRCKNLVQDLLVFSRTTRADRVPMEINKAVEGAISLVRAQAGVRNVEVRHELARDLPLILGSQTQIQQIVINLASNAMDAMPHGGTLLIKTDLMEDKTLSWVCLSVQDTGSGIPPEVLPKIFDPFFTTKPSGQGTGLGLSLVYDIVSKHSSTIEVQSQPGRTEFRVKFPSRATHESPQSQMAA